MKTLKFKINNFLILIFFIIPFSSSAEDLFLINPSSQCKKYLSESFSNILNIDKGVYKLSIIDDGLTVKTQSNYKFEYLYSIQGNDAFMIISKEKKSIGTLTIMDAKSPCRSKITNNLEIFKSNNNELKNKTDLAKNDLPNQDDDTQIKKFSAECSAGHIRIENKCIKKEFLDEFENQLNSNIEILKNELANLKKEKQKKNLN